MPNGETITCDICVIGAGVAGITLVSELLGTNADICLIESGDTKAKQEHMNLNKGDNVGLNYYALDRARGRQVGGSSRLWGIRIQHYRYAGRLRPLSPIDFEKREWVPNSGWPFDYRHIAPFYKRAHLFCNGGDYKYNIDQYKLKNKLKPLPFDSDAIETVIFRFAPRAKFVKRGIERFKHAHNLKLIIKSNALEVMTNSAGSVSTGIRVGTLRKNSFTVRAKIVVLALGGIETPRLLLNSDSVHEHGLGNQNDLIGRYFMEHPHLWSGLLIPNTKDGFKYCRLYDKERLAHRTNEFFLGQLAVPEDVLRREKMLSYSCHIKPTRRSSLSNRWLGGDLRQAWRESIDMFGAIKAYDLYALRRSFRATHPLLRNLSLSLLQETGNRLNKSMRRYRWHEVYQLNHMSEQIPNRDSRVVLGEERDALGLRQVKLKWQLTEMDIWNMRRAQELIHQEAVRSKFGIVEISMKDNSVPKNIHGGYHHMGTTRMHVNPSEGVVDTHCRVHGMHNVYITGAQVFPTVGYANPVLTIVALAIRLADHLKEKSL